MRHPSSFTESELNFFDADTATHPVLSLLFDSRRTSPQEAVLAVQAQHGDPDAIELTWPFRAARGITLISDPDIARVLLQPSNSDKIGPPSTGRLGINRIIDPDNPVPGFLFSPTDGSWRQGREAVKTLIWGNDRVGNFADAYRDEFQAKFKEAASAGGVIEDAYEFVAGSVGKASMLAVMGLEIDDDEAKEMIATNATINREFSRGVRTFGLSTLRTSRRALDAGKKLRDVSRRAIFASEDNSARKQWEANDVSRQMMISHTTGLVSGFLSVAKTAAFGLHELAKDANAQEWLRSGAGEGGVEGRARALSNEMLRFYPSVWLSPRVMFKGATVGDIDIQPGDRVISSPLLIGRSRKVWGDKADHFVYDRFPGVSGKELLRLESKVNLAAFGFGERKCVGMHLGRKVLEELIIVASQFDLTSLDDPSPQYGISMKPANAKMTVSNH